MKPPAEIAASIWERFKKPLVTLLGNDAEALAALERRLVPEIRKAIETERAGWPTEKEWMDNLDVVFWAGSKTFSKLFRAKTL